MPSEDREPVPTSPLALPDLLALISGLELLLALHRIDRIRADWSQVGRLLLYGIAFILIFTGLKQTLTAMWPRLGQSRFGPISNSHRHRVMLPRLPREGLVYLGIMAVLFVGSLLGRSNTLMLVFAMMAGPFVLNGWITFTLLKRVKVKRRIPKRAMAGDVVSVEIELANRKRFFSSWLMAARDQLGNQDERLDGSVLFARVPPRSHRTGYYEMRLARRGKYAFGPLELTTRFPMGLVERGQLFDVSDEMVIQPRVGRLASHWKQRLLMASELAERQSTRPGLFDDDFQHLREYRAGDNPRAIHWRTSARRNELMVREYHQCRDQHLAVFVDLWLPESPSEDELDRVELAVSFAATVCLEHLKQSRESRMHLAVAGQEINRWEARSGLTSVESMLDMLAVVQAGPSPDLGKMFYDALPVLSPNTKSLLVTTRERDTDEYSRLNESRSNGNSSDASDQIQVIVADPDQLSPLFALE